MVETALAPYAADLDILIFHESESEIRKLVCAYDSGTRRARFPPFPPRLAQASTERTLNTKLDVAGRQWSIECEPTSYYLSRHRSFLPAVVASLMGVFVLQQLVVLFMLRRRGQSL
jgi:CHASE1-domain containing sensor protein